MSTTQVPNPLAAPREYIDYVIGLTRQLPKDDYLSEDGRTNSLVEMYTGFKPFREPREFVLSQERTEQLIAPYGDPERLNAFYDKMQDAPPAGVGSYLLRFPENVLILQQNGNTFFGIMAANDGKRHPWLAYRMVFTGGPEAAIDYRFFIQSRGMEHLDVMLCDQALMILLFLLQEEKQAQAGAPSPDPITVPGAVPQGNFSHFCP
jgi:hypothetical protein